MRLGADFKKHLHNAKRPNIRGRSVCLWCGVCLSRCALPCRRGADPSFLRLGARLWQNDRQIAARACYSVSGGCHGGACASHANNTPSHFFTKTIVGKTTLYFPQKWRSHSESNRERLSTNQLFCRLKLCDRII